MSLNICVTGATGFLGRRLISTLVSDEAPLNIRCLVRPTSDTAELLSQVSSNSDARIEIARGDLSDQAFLDAQLEEIDVVFHLAAALGGSTSTMFLNTVVPTRRLIQAAITNQVQRFVLVSSLGVYGTADLRRGAVLDETTPIDAHPELRDPYSFSKVRQEQVAWQAREQFGLPLVVVRPGVIYGPGRSPITSRVGLPVGPLLIRMGGRHQLPYTFVDNCADAIKHAGLTTGTEGEVFNVVDDNLPTGNRILREARKTGKRVRAISIPNRAIGPLARIYETYSNWSQGQLPPVLTRYKSQAMWKPLRYTNAKARHILNWRPAISTEEGLRRTFTGNVAANG